MPKNKPKTPKHIKKARTHAQQKVTHRVTTPTYSVKPEHIAGKLDVISQKRREYTKKPNDPYAQTIDGIKDKIVGNSDSFGGGLAQYREDIEKEINQLQWTMGSMISSAANATAMFLACLCIVGLVIYAHNASKAKDDPTKGNPFLIFKSGLKQKVAEVVEPHLKTLPSAPKK